MGRRRAGKFARFGLCLIMIGVVIYGLLGLISATEAEGVFAGGNPGPVTDGSIHTYNKCIVQFVSIGTDMVDSLVPYIGGVILVAVAGLFLAFRKYAGDNYHV